MLFDAIGYLLELILSTLARFFRRRGLTPEQLKALEEEERRQQRRFQILVLVTIVLTSLLFWIIIRLASN